MDGVPFAMHHNRPHWRQFLDDNGRNMDSKYTSSSHYKPIDIVPHGYSLKPGQFASYQSEIGCQSCRKLREEIEDLKKQVELLQQENASIKSKFSSEQLDEDIEQHLNELSYSPIEASLPPCSRATNPLISDDASVDHLHSEWSYYPYSRRHHSSSSLQSSPFHRASSSYPQLPSHDPYFMHQPTLSSGLDAEEEDLEASAISTVTDPKAPTTEGIDVPGHGAGEMYQDNDIVKRAKAMYTMAYSMYQFSRGEGELKTTQDLFNQAEFFTEEANKFYKVVRQFTYQVPSGPLKKELLENLHKVPTFVQQLQFSVKNSTVGKAATFTKVDNVIQETKNLMDFISKTVNSCLTCASQFNLDMASQAPLRALSPSGPSGSYDYDDDRMGSKGGGSSDASL